MVHAHTPGRRATHAAPAPSRFDALCMALGLSDGAGLQSHCPQPPAPKLRLAPSGGVRKVQRQPRCKLTAAAAEHGMATPPRLADRPRRHQPFAVGRLPRPLPAAWRAQHAAQRAQQAARATDSVTSPNLRSVDFSGDSRCVTSPALLSTTAGTPLSSPSDPGAILAAGMGLILASMSPADACQLAAARHFLAAFPPAC